MRERKKVIFAVAAAGFLAAGVFAYFILPADAKDSLKNGAAIVVQSFKDVFGPPKDNLIVSEIGFQPVSAPSSSAEASAEITQEVPVAEKIMERRPDPKPAKREPILPVTPIVAPTATLAKVAGAAAPVAVVEKTPLPVCDFGAAMNASPSREIIINEIAWMGSPPTAGETASRASSREWLELKNISSGDIDLSRWQLVDVSGSIAVAFGDGERMSAGSFYLLERGDEAVPQISARKTYSGALSNNGDILVLLDVSCAPSDRLNASAGWPGGDNATKATLERNADGAGWHTSARPGGTPGAENSIPALAGAATESEPTKHLVTVSLIGDGTGLVSSSPPGILCGFDCMESFASGTLVTFSAAPSLNAAFVGWTGPCGGTGACSFKVASASAITANFRLIKPPPSGPPPGGSSGGGGPTSSPAPSSTPRGVNHLVIAGIQIAGTSTNNDFVRILNPTEAAIDLSGWKLRKKLKTGTDSSLREFPNGSSVAAGGYFTWANSADGFAESIGANAASTQTLAVDNSVALFDAGGTMMDAVAWGEGAGQYVEGSAYPANPDANKVLTRKMADGAVIDTGNNADDFFIL